MSSIDCFHSYIKTQARLALASHERWRNMDQTLKVSRLRGWWRKTAKYKEWTMPTLDTLSIALITLPNALTEEEIEKYALFLEKEKR